MTYRIGAERIAITDEEFGILDSMGRNGDSHLLNDLFVS